MQYYNGSVQDGEMVQFVREPENQYDGWCAPLLHPAWLPFPVWLSTYTAGYCWIWFM